MKSGHHVVELDSVLDTLDLHTGGHRRLERSWLVARSPGGTYLSPTTWLLTTSDLTSRSTVSTKCLEKLESLLALFIISRLHRGSRAAISTSWDLLLLKLKIKTKIMSSLRKWLTSFRRNICETFDCLLIASLAAIKWFWNFSSSVALKLTLLL